MYDLKQQDFETLKNKLDALEKAAQQMAEAMYKQQAEQQQSNESSNHNDDVVDADFKTKD